MLLVSACRLPDPNKQDYDILLQTILNTLDEYVENDYVVILLTAQTIHKPSARWVLKAYRALSRKFVNEIEMSFNIQYLNIKTDIGRI
jgi:Rho GTPase-activating protein 1